MIISSKFGIGQQVRHKESGNLGVVIDVDPEFTLQKTIFIKIFINNDLLFYPWYHVILEDYYGKPIHTYLAESQLSESDELTNNNTENLTTNNNTENLTLDELSNSIKIKFKSPGWKN